MHEPAGLPIVVPQYLACGCCGGRYGLITNDRFGRLNHHRRATCDNNRTIRRQNIEPRVLSGLNDKLVSAEPATEAVRACTLETNCLNQDRRARNEADRRAPDRTDSPWYPSMRLFRPRGEGEWDLCVRRCFRRVDGAHEIELGRQRKGSLLSCFERGETVTRPAEYSQPSGLFYNLTWLVRVR